MGCIILFTCGLSDCFYLCRYSYSFVTYVGFVVCFVVFDYGVFVVIGALLVGSFDGLVFVVCCST